MKKKNTKRKRPLGKVGFLFFDLLFAFAISTILITIVLICTTFLTKRFMYLQEHELAKQLLHKTICDLEQKIFYISKNVVVQNIAFTITNQILIMQHTPLAENISKMPVVKTTISWNGSDNQKKYITVQRFYLEIDIP